MAARITERRKAKIFWMGRSQAVRLPKEFRFEGDSVLIRKEGNAVILEPSRRGWPEGWVESFSGMPDDFERPPQGKFEKRKKLR